MKLSKKKRWFWAKVVLLVPALGLLLSGAVDYYNVTHPSGPALLSQNGLSVGGVSYAGILFDGILASILTVAALLLDIIEHRP